MTSILAEASGEEGPDGGLASDQNGPILAFRDARWNLDFPGYSMEV